MKDLVNVFDEMSIPTQDTFRKVTNHTFSVKDDSGEKKLHIYQVNLVVHAKIKIKLNIIVVG